VLSAFWFRTWVGDRLGIPWGADGFFGSVLGWAAAWEDLRVLSALSF